MGQLNAPPNNPQLPPIPINYQFEHPNLQRIKQTPFLRAALYSYEPGIYLEKPDLTLSSLLTPRLNTTGLFPQPQVLKLIKSVIQALSFLQGRQIRYGDLTTQTIYYDRATKTFKLINPFLLQSTSYQLTKKGLRFSYLSPELLLSLSEQVQNIDISIIPKSDIFVFGIILLEVCTLRLSTQIYDPQSYNILDSKIQEKIQLIRGFYSERLCSIITLMLQYDIQRRISAKQIKQILLQSEPHIQQPANNFLQMNKIAQMNQNNQIPQNLINMNSPKRQKTNPFQQILQGSGQQGYQNRKFG